MYARPQDGSSDRMKLQVVTIQSHYWCASAVIGWQKSNSGNKFGKNLHWKVREYILFLCNFYIFYKARERDSVLSAHQQLAQLWRCEALRLHLIKRFLRFHRHRLIIPSVAMFNQRHVYLTIFSNRELYDFQPYTCMHTIVMKKIRYQFKIEYIKMCFKN